MLKFIHITKTGGSTMKCIGANNQINWGTADNELKNVYNGNKNKLLIPFWHCPFRYISTPKLQDYLNKYKFFAIVRNPYSRCLSEFHCTNGGPTNPVFRNMYKKTIDQYTITDFNDFITNRLNDMNTIVERLEMSLNIIQYKSNIMLSFSIGGHWLPQYLYTHDRQNNQIPEHILKFENLQHDFDSLMKQYDLNIILDKHIRPGKYRFGVDDLSEKNKLLIQKVYAKDFQYFGYVF